MITSKFSSLVLAAACLLVVSSAKASPINLGAAADYAVLGVGGTTTSGQSDFEVYQSGTVINGNVGMGPRSRLTHGIDATIKGRFDYDTTASLNGQKTGGVQGGINQVSLSNAVADARSAS